MVAGVLTVDPGVQAHAAVGRVRLSAGRRHEIRMPHRRGTEDSRSVLDEFRRITRPGGTVAVVVNRSPRPERESEFVGWGMVFVGRHLAAEVDRVVWGWLPIGARRVCVHG